MSSHTHYSVYKLFSGKPIAILVLEEPQLGNPQFLERVKPYLDLTVYDKKRHFIETMHVKYIMSKVILTILGKHRMIFGKRVDSKQGLLIMNR